MGSYTDQLFKRKREAKLAGQKAQKVVFDEVEVPTEDDQLIIESDRKQIKLWLDDERVPEEGWTWAKSVHEAMRILNEDVVVIEMSLDWYLGDGVLDGQFFVEEVFLKMHYLGRPEVFANTTRINCHSSDRDRRIKMAQVAQAAQEQGHCSPRARISIIRR